MQNPVHSHTKSPFEPFPDKGRSFEHPSYAEAIKSIEAAIMSYSGVVVITGPVGSGKIRVVEEVLGRYPLSNLEITRIRGSEARENGLLATLAGALGLPDLSTASQPAMADLVDALVEKAEEGHFRLLVIEGAEHLDIEALAELQQMLTAFGHVKPGLQLFLLATPELMVCLQDSSLLGLSARVLFYVELQALSVEQTQAYIFHRLAQAGWKETPRFTGEAVQLIHRASAGVPGVINTLCNELLDPGSEIDQTDIDAEDVERACLALGRGTSVRRDASLPGDSGQTSVAEQSDSDDAITLYESTSGCAEQLTDPGLVSDDQVLVLTEEVENQADLDAFPTEKVEAPDDSSGQSIHGVSGTGWKRRAALVGTVILALVIWYFWERGPAPEVPESEPALPTGQPPLEGRKPPTPVPGEEAVAVAQRQVPDVAPLSDVSLEVASAVELDRALVSKEAEESIEASTLERSAPEVAENMPSATRVGKVSISSDAADAVEAVVAVGVQQPFLSDSGVTRVDQRLVISDDLESALRAHVYSMTRLDNGTLRLGLPSLIDPPVDNYRSVLSWDVERLAFVLRNFVDVRVELKVAELPLDTPQEIENRVQLAHHIRSELVSFGLFPRFVRVVQIERNKVESGWLNALVAVEILPRGTEA